MLLLSGHAMDNAVRGGGGVLAGIFGIAIVTVIVIKIAKGGVDLFIVYFSICG